MSVKRDPTDIVFSKLVRERNEYICQSCGYDGRHNPAFMDCAHIHSRKHRATRWHPDGAICLCKSCHRRYTDFPLEWSGFVRELYGDARADEIMRLAHSIRKYTKAEKLEMRKHYREELKKMLDRRKNGETGYLEFVGYD